MKKAKDYYELYKLDLMSEDDKKVSLALWEFILALSNDAQELIKLRHVEFDCGVIPIMKEMNQKWNTVVRLFEKEYGGSPIKPDGFKIFWIEKMPELDGKI